MRHASRFDFDEGRTCCRMSTVRPSGREVYAVVMNASHVRSRVFWPTSFVRTLCCAPQPQELRYTYAKGGGVVARVASHVLL